MTEWQTRGVIKRLTLTTGWTDTKQITTEYSQKEDNNKKNNNKRRGKRNGEGRRRKKKGKERKERKARCRWVYGVQVNGLTYTRTHGFLTGWVGCQRLDTERLRKRPNNAAGLDQFHKITPNRISIDNHVIQTRSTVSVVSEQITSEISDAANTVINQTVIGVSKCNKWQTGEMRNEIAAICRAINGISGQSQCGFKALLSFFPLFLERWQTHRSWTGLRFIKVV